MTTSRLEPGRINGADALIISLAMWHVRRAPQPRAALVAKLLEPVARQLPLRRFLTGVERRIGQVLDDAIDAGLLGAETAGAAGTDVVCIGPDVTAGELDVMFALLKDALTT